MLRADFNWMPCRFMSDLQRMLLLSRHSYRTFSLDFLSLLLFVPCCKNAYWFFHELVFFVLIKTGFYLFVSFCVLPEILRHLAWLFDSYAQTHRARPPKYVSKVIIVMIWIISLLFSSPFMIAFRVYDATEERYGKYNNAIEFYCKNTFKLNRLSFYIVQHRMDTYMSTHVPFVTMWICQRINCFSIAIILHLFRYVLFCVNMLL